MSKQSRDELLAAIRPQYLESNRAERKALRDSFVLASGYGRKYAIRLLEHGPKKVTQRKANNCKYNSDVRQALIVLWKVGNQICSKRLVPFLPTLIVTMERGGHLTLSAEVKEKLLQISPATADRLLKQERQKHQKGKSTTRPGTLLKKHIPVRTFADWDELKPGFFEADLVAHCGGSIRGQFLHTLTMTDIATGWTELQAIPRKGATEVLNALICLKSVLPFPKLGFDTDNGGEFINDDVFRWCGKHKINFTRSRAYRKNDQAHVEEKNGSIVRRIVGYDRFQGNESFNILYRLYRLVRLYTNFFQPSMKLTSKLRDGARVQKKYDVALTPCQRVLQSKSVSKELKQKLLSQFEQQDPLYLLKEIERLQTELFASAVKMTKPQAA
jgi:hypothetical protein